MIGEEELELAIADADGMTGVDALVQFAVAGIDLGPVRQYARRYAAVKALTGADYSEAAAGGFLLGFRLGVLASRHERTEG